MRRPLLVAAPRAPVRAETPAAAQQQGLVTIDSAHALRPTLDRADALEGVRAPAGGSTA